jgi:F0F1-type ATP synthase membrane subunit c/vacuolar-type H+-ATPase subunit K/hemin uptake protein HemP
MERNKRNRGGSGAWPPTPRHLIAALAIAGAAVLPGVAQAQTGCSGAIGIATTPNTFPPNELLFTGVPLGETVGMTLTPASGAGSNLLTVGQVDFALTCANNGDIVPCTGGNDVGANTGLNPIAFAGNVGGTCGATSRTDNGDGTVTFNFTPLALGTAGCTITFDVTVDDIGTDATPLSLTSAAATVGGTCLGGALQGTARGSSAIFLETVPDIEIVKEISIDGGTTWFDANDAGSAPTAVFPSGALYRLRVTNTGTAPLINVVVNDAELGIVNAPVADLAPGESVLLEEGDIPALFAEDRCTESGTFTNTASTSGESAHNGATVNDSDPAVLKCVGTPDIDLRKQISVDGKAVEDVTKEWFDADAVLDPDVPEVTFPHGAMYRFIVENTGTAPLTNVTVSDPDLGIGATLIADLAVGEQVTIDSGDIPALTVAERCDSSGNFINTASVSAESTETGEGVNDSNPAVLVCVGVPNIEILKEISLNGTDWFDANTEGAAPIAVFPSGALYRLTVTNIGSAPLTDVVVNDPTLGIVNHPVGDLAPGVFVVLDQGDIPVLNVATRCDESGTFGNTASTSGESAETGASVNDSDPAFLVCVGRPDIDIEKQISVDGGTTWLDADDAAGAPVVTFPSGAMYQFVVTNTGTAPLVNVTVQDAELGIASTVIPGTLDPGDSVIIGSGDIPALTVAERCDSAGEFTNVAAVSANSEETGAGVNDSDPAVLVCEGDDLCLTRTPGFWGTHPHVTVQYLDIEVCGKPIDTTEAGTNHSSAEAMCMSGTDAKKGGSNMHYLQLVRQLTAAKLNVAASLDDGGTCDTVGGVDIDDLIERCEAAALCGDSGPKGGSLITASGCIGLLDAFNNSEDTLDVFGPFVSPGPAAPGECQEANGNGVIVK